MERIKSTPDRVENIPAQSIPAQAVLFSTSQDEQIPSAENPDVVTRKSAYGMISFDQVKQKLTLEGQALQTSPTETKFLGHLVTRGCFVTVPEIVSVIYPDEDLETDVQFDARIHDFASFLRRKIGDDFIISKHKAGYCLNYGSDSPSLLSDAFTVGEFVISPSAYRLEYRGKIIDLTNIEYKIFDYLLSKKSFVRINDVLRVISQYHAEVKEQTIGTMVRDLRKKLGAKLLINIPYVGYRLVIPGDDNMELPQDTERVGDFEITSDTYQISFRRKTIPLTPTEFMIFRLLIRNLNRITGFDKFMLDYGRDDDNNMVSSPEVLQLMVSSIRKKFRTIFGFEAPIVTVRKHGYKMQSVKSDPESADHMK